MQLPFDDCFRRRIYLMRHGDVAYFSAQGVRVPDSRAVVLTEKGRSEALAMREILSSAPIDKAVCSGLPRTVETGAIVLGGRTVTLEVDPDFEEIRGGSPEQRAQLTPPEYAYSMYFRGEMGETYAKGEVAQTFFDRVTGAYRRLLTEIGWHTCLLAAHGGVNRAILSSIVGSGVTAMGAFEQDTGCLNVIDVDTSAKDGRVVRQIARAVNLTPQDPAKIQNQLTTMETLALKAFGRGPHTG